MEKRGERNTANLPKNERIQSQILGSHYEPEYTTLLFSYIMPLKKRKNEEIFEKRKFIKKNI